MPTEEKQLTAMSELRNKIKDVIIEAEQLRESDKHLIVTTLSIIIDHIDFISLATERQRIIDAVNYGNRQEFYDATESIGETYYNNTFKTQ